MNYENFRVLFDLMCETFREEEGKKDLFFHAAYEVESQDGVTMMFVFDLDPFRNQRLRRCTLVYRFVSLAEEPFRSLCSACHPPVNADECVDMVGAVRGAGTFSELFQ